MPAISLRLKSSLSLAFLLCLFAANCAFAQLVGAKDLTQLSPTSPGSAKANSATAEKKYCDPSGGIADGDQIAYPSPKLSLSILRAELETPDSDPSIAVTLRLKNVGDESTSLPWVSWPVESAQLSEDGQTKTLGYELATIDFFLGPHHTNDPEPRPAGRGCALVTAWQSEPTC
jgi:hypothetical protein